MFTTMRRNRRSNKMKSELGQGVDHFRRAAALAAQETSSTVGPRFAAAKGRVQPAATKARDAATSGWGSTLALATTAAQNVRSAGDSVRQNNKEAAKEISKATRKSAKAGKKANQKNAKKLDKSVAKALSRKQSGGRGSKLLGLALIGGAVGAGAAYFVRKRQTAQWDEYDAADPITTSPSATTPAVTAPVATTDDAAFAPATPAATTTPAGELFDANPSVVNNEVDQTSSALHSPEVARLAGGKSTKE